MSFGVIMEILIIVVMSCILMAMAYLHHRHIQSIHTREAAIKKSLEETERTLKDTQLTLTKLRLELATVAMENTSTSKQYNELLMIVLPRLFHMELAAYIHQQGVVRQVICFNDEKLKLAIATMLCIVLERFDDVPNPTQFAQEMVERDHYITYFKEHVVAGPRSGALRITGRTGFDALNIVIDAILSHGENKVIGTPLYNIVSKRPVAPI